MKLTDTQLVLLSAASQREDRELELPPTLKGGAAQKVIGKLLTGGLVEESRGRPGMPIWRKDEEERPITLRITKQGLTAIRVDDDGVPRETTAGAAVRQPKQTKSKKGSQRKADQRKGTGSKQSAVIALLSRPEGAKIAEIMKVTDWQQHSVRGFLAAVIRKKLKLNLQSEKRAGERVYRICSRKRAAA
jgi:hypothetical protein